MGYGPGWILLGACVGAGGAVAAQFVNNLLTRKREQERLKLTTFDLFRRQFMEDKRLHGIENKEEKLSVEEMDYYLRFFDVIGLYWKKDLLDIDLVDEVFGDSVMLVYDDEKIRKSIYEERGRMKDPTYFENLEKLAIELSRKKKSRLNPE
jgi:hypothetical protein